MAGENFSTKKTNYLIGVKLLSVSSDSLLLLTQCLSMVVLLTFYQY